MIRVTINVGLRRGVRTAAEHPARSGLFDEAQRLDAAVRWAVDMLDGPVYVQRYAGTEDAEPCVVLEGTVPVRDGIRFDLHSHLYRLAVYLDQDCIAAQVHHTATGLREPGFLEGPYPKGWEPFQQRYFRTIKL